MILVSWVYQVSIGSPACGEFSLFLRNAFCGCDFFGNILGIHFIGQIFQLDRKVCLLVFGVEPVCDGNEAALEEWKHQLDILAGFQIVSA